MSDPQLAQYLANFQQTHDTVKLLTGLKFTPEEIAAVEAMSKRKDLPIPAVIKQALRLQQMTDTMHSDGLYMEWFDSHGVRFDPDIHGCAGE